MSIQDFIERSRKRAESSKLSPGQQEIQEFAEITYNDIKDGRTKAWVKEVSKSLVQDIAPDLPEADKRKAALMIERVAVTVLCELFDSGTLIKREEYKDAP